MFAVATISSTLCTIESYLYLHDLCVLCVLVYAFMYFYVYMGQVPEIKLMMMIAHCDMAKCFSRPRLEKDIIQGTIEKAWQTEDNLAQQHHVMDRTWTETTVELHCESKRDLISEGSVATRLRCGGQCDSQFVANFVMNSRMEKFRKSVNICQSYGQKYRGPFFDSQCIYVYSSAYWDIIGDNSFGRPTTYKRGLRSFIQLLLTVKG